MATKTNSDSIHKMNYVWVCIQDRCSVPSVAFRTEAAAEKWAEEMSRQAEITYKVRGIEFFAD